MMETLFKSGNYLYHYWYKQNHSVFE